MPERSVASQPKTPYRLTEKEWQEVKECSSALFAVVGVLRDLPKRAEVGGLEALECVQRRLSLAVSAASNRIEGTGSIECPFCGSQPSEAPCGESKTRAK